MSYITISNDSPPYFFTTIGVILNEPADWPRWYRFIEHAAREIGVWDIVNPEETILSEECMVGGYGPRTDNLKNELIAINEERYRTELAEWEMAIESATRGPRPTPPAKPTTDELVIKYRAAMKAFTEEQELGGFVDTKRNIWAFINVVHRTVDSTLLRTALYTNYVEDNPTGGRALLRTLKHQVGYMEGMIGNIPTHRRR